MSALGSVISKLGGGGGGVSYVHPRSIAQTSDITQGALIRP